ncbi:M20 family peptidase [Aquincola sp. S2]|uniref:M20 family peptidase n=1 Tax=Pseudaquabacterium terrae TaxID=2732868 RepID=A0ABX2EJ87_9BURK|nr:M20 family peptidase [Aquabacterium terrae]NRF68712.1 M20 family peptidase [Aquabacterium terrae]
MLKRALLGLVALIALLVVVLAVNTWRQGSRQLDVPAVQGLVVDEGAVAASLAVAIRARTISSLDDPSLNADQFKLLHEHLQVRYPKLHATLQREVIGGLSLLYTWRGSDAAAPGIALMAHQDVVPVAPGTEDDWQAQPFGGEVMDGFVWGRGSWDDKGNLIAQLEAVEALVAAGFKPQRSIYLVFGADEEVGGERGALQIAKLLQQRGVKLDFVIDEGLLITHGLLKGLTPPAALVGVAEKGYLSMQLQAKATPGHSSMPPPEAGRSAIAQMSRALVKLDQQPMPASIGGIAGEMFDAVAPEMSGFPRVALSNRWLFGPVLRGQLEQAPSTNALLRTTTALTIVNAGNKDNVLPGRAEGVVNFRLLPGSTIESVTEHVRRVIADDGIELKVLPGSSNPSAVASTSSRGYQAITRTIRELFPGTVVAPGLMLGGTDSRHFQALSPNIFKFSPVRAGPEDLSRFHGTNERIALTNLAELVRFYHRLLQQSAGPPSSKSTEGASP